MAEPGVYAVVPAAGRGRRLGAGTAKIMVEIADGVRLWHLLHRRLRPWVAHLRVVVAPDTEAAFRDLAAAEIRAGEVSVSVQDQPRGMGDAVFGTAGDWAGHDAVLVVWGDQVGLSTATVGRVVAAHRRATAAGRPGLALPLVALPDPYVEYEVTPADAASEQDYLVKLCGVRQSREGQPCRPGGLSDVGVFCLSTRGLAAAWQDYLAGAQVGTATGEVNFLPFLPYLSQVRGWAVRVVPVDDPEQARGVNTPQDLAHARATFRRCGG